MNEINKKNYEHSSIKSFKRKIISKSNHSKILLKNYSYNNRNISKNLKETEETPRKNSNSIELPLIKSSKETPIILNKCNESNFSINDLSNSEQNQLQKLLFNSISFDDYQKSIIDLKLLNKNKDILPKINIDEEKVKERKDDSNLNEFNNPNLFSKNNLIKFKANNKRYSFCLKTLCQLNNNKYSSNLVGIENNIKNIYNISKAKILREIILNEYNERNINFEEQKILSNFKYYNKWIKKKLLELKKEIPVEETFHRTLEKEFKNSKYNKPLLNLNSLSITFTCKGKCHSFHIPFEFVPLFYYKNMNYLKYILISIIKFVNDYEDIYIDYDEIIYLLSCSKQFEIKDDDDLAKKEEILLDKNINSINNFNHKKLLGSTQLINNKEEIKSAKLKKTENEIKFEENNSYKCIYNKFIFKWKTPKYIYDVIVKAPEVIFRVGKLVLQTYIDIELIFFLIGKNFKNWDFYVSQYIFSYKEFLINMGKLISKKSSGQLYPKESIKFPLIILNNQSTKEIYSKKIKINNINSEKIKQISDKCKKFEFIYTDENNNNYIKILHNFFILARCKSFINNKFCFDFNFFHMKILNKILRIQGLEYFFKKLIYIDRQTSSLQFRYDELTELANEQYKILEIQGPNKSGSQFCIRMKERNSEIINFTTSFPTLETIKYNNKNYDNCFESDYDNAIFNGISLNILNDLCIKNFEEWPEILTNL